MKRWATQVALVSALALAVAACGDDEAEDTAVDIDEPTPTEEPADEPTDEPTEEPTEEPEEEPADDSDDEADDAGEESDDEAADGAESVRVWVVRDFDGQLWLESERRDLVEPTVAVADAAMTELLAQPTMHPELSAPAGTDNEVLGVDIADGVLTVDVDGTIRDAATGADGEEALQQALAHTGAQFDSVDEVVLHVDGAPVDELWGHVDWSAPVVPDDELLGFIDVEEPGWLDAHGVDEPVTVSGTSLTYESNVPLTLVDPNGEIVEESFTTAEQPDVGVRGPFEHTFDAVPDRPGMWTIIANEPDPSGGEADRQPYYVEVSIEVE